MLTFVVYLAVACFVGLVVLGHLLVLQALFISADHAEGKHDRRLLRGWQPDVRL